MSRDAATGIYTRVSNSFSQPVIGTTIDPNDADTFFDDVEAAMNSFIGTSATSLAIGTGAKNFTTQTGKTFIPGTFIQAISRANVANYMYGTITSYDAGTGALVVEVTDIGGSGTLDDWSLFFSGVRGGTGATGPQGNESGFKYTFNTATSGDPGSGKFLFNNATFSSATAMSISETDGDGNSLATILATMDDSTSTNKCLVMFRKENDTEAFLAYITGTLTDNGAYDTFSVTPISALGTMANNDVCRLIPIRTGDKGADGAGTGDVVGPAASVDGEIALFSLTTGKLLKRATTTGLLKATSGVLSAAVSNTDYCAATSGSSVLKGASGGTTAATAGTDFMKSDTTSNLTKGFTATSFSAGTKSTGTYTPDPADGNFQHATNGGAHTLAPPASVCTIVVEYLNNGSAGAITTSGFTKVTGDAFTTTNTNKFVCFITKTNSYSQLHVQALQ